MGNFTYLIGDEARGDAAIVDPAWDVDRLLTLAAGKGLVIKYVLNTHGHSDHCSGNERVVERTGAKVLGNENATTKKDAVVSDGDTVRVGSIEVRVIYTPGHSPDGTCFLVNNKLLTGDTLFVGECGGVTYGDPRALYHSLFDRILRLDDSIEVYPGHNYGESPSSTIGYERRNNYTLRPRTEEEFVRFMREP